MVKIIIGLILIALFLPLQSFSKDGSSGCGLGWAVTKRKSLVSSSIRSTTNATASNTSAMTTGTSGCARHSIVKTEAQAVVYAQANYDNLMLETAQGDGEFLRGFVKVLGCNQEAYSAFSATLKAKYESFNQNLDPLEFLEKTKVEIKTNPALAAHCTAS